MASAYTLPPSLPTPPVGPRKEPIRPTPPSDGTEWHITLVAFSGLAFILFILLVVGPALNKNSGPEAEQTTSAVYDRTSPRVISQLDHGWNIYQYGSTCFLSDMSRTTVVIPCTDVPPLSY